VTTSLSVNGRVVTATHDSRMTLLDLLREELALGGTKKGCDHGQCGSCTVLVDGERALACLTLTVALRGRSVRTVEGVAEADHLHPIQGAFIKHDAFQCGFCTPGQIMSAIALLKSEISPTREAIREYMSGNVCRCGAYNGIVDAIYEVSHHGSVSLPAR
jgi:xanthine dehydrogenase YagT iron-sulfur-binding subunit